MTAGPLIIRNCEPAAIGSVPLFPANVFYATIQEQLSAGGHAAAYFGYHFENTVHLMAVIARHANGSFALFSCKADNEMRSLASNFPQLQLFEREIAEQFGISFKDHPWFKPVRFHKPFHQATNLFGQPIGAMDYFAMEGDEIHEVAVVLYMRVSSSPAISGSCHGENVYHLEISLGYQHRVLSSF